MGACVVNSSIAASSQRFAGDFLRVPTARTRRRSIDVLFLRPKNPNPIISKIAPSNRQRKKVVVSVAAGDVVDEISDPAGQQKQQQQDALSTSELDEGRAGSTNAISIDGGGVLASPSSSSSHQLDLDLDLDLKVEGGEDFDKMSDRALNAAIVLAAGSFAITKLLTIDRDYWHGWTIYEILRYAPQHNWIAYEEALKENPVLAKMMISGVVYSVGDWIAQCYEGKPLFDFDRIRMFRSGLVGFTLHGSLSHYYYYFCEALFPSRDWWVVPAKVVFDQTVWSAIWNSIYFVVLGFLRLESPFNIVRELKATFWPMLTAGWKLWPFAHLITYGVIPVEQRLLWVDCVELVWVTILSTYSNEKSEARHLEAASEPAYLMDRDTTTRAKVLSNTVKQKRKEKAGKWDVPLPKVRPVAEDEMFKVIRTGKRKTKQWKRMVTKVTFVGPGFTRKPPKYERFIRPMGLRFTKAHVTHPELKCTFNLEIIGIKKNPNGPMYTSLGVITKGTIIEVNVSELGLVTDKGKVVWGKYAQVTNNPENDGCINAVLLV